ncbi:TPA: restriction endonuclease subunit S, partial [Streptococcus suis]|nr:restriction endonuclease subunit S [Streptococcus suis]
MKTNNNIPAYRFQGYTDAWELRPLGEIGNTYTGLSGKTKDDFGHGDGRFVTYMNVFSNPISLPEMVEAVEIDESQNTVRYGDVLFTTSSETPEEVGMSSVWLGNTENTYLNSFCFGFRPVKKVNPYYLAYLLRSSGMRRKISFLAQGISRYNISKTKMMELEISIPNENEQSAIGTFFSTLDRQITLHQRKLDTLKEQKKSYLKLLFPAKGQTKPALRFQGFEDDWEVKRISDIGDIVTGNTPSTSNEDYYSNEGMMWVTPTDIDGLIITDTNKKLSPEGEKVSRIVPANSILVTCIASIGKNTLLLEAGSFNQQINAVVPNQSLYHSYFLLTQSYFWSESMKRIAPAATMQIINKNEFSN